MGVFCIGIVSSGIDFATIKMTEVAKGIVLKGRYM